VDALTFIAKLVEFLAWPVAAVILVLLLRGEIKGLFRYLKKLKAGPVEAEFEREVQELKATAEAQPQLLPPPEGATPEKQMLLQLVQINPRSAVLEAWRGVEEASVRVIQSKGFYVPEREAHSPLAVIRSLRVQREHFTFIQGSELVATFDAPIRDAPPAYRACFCSRCGSPVPDPSAGPASLEIPAGLLDDDPGLRPERHIHVEAKSEWFAIHDDLPQLDKAAIERLRQQSS
jgi:hypothetical protein